MNSTRKTFLSAAMLSVVVATQSVAFDHWPDGMDGSSYRFVSPGLGDIQAEFARNGGVWP